MSQFWPTSWNSDHHRSLILIRWDRRIGIQLLSDTVIIYINIDLLIVAFNSATLVSVTLRSITLIVMTLRLNDIQPTAIIRSFTFLISFGIVIIHTDTSTIVYSCTVILNFDFDLVGHIRCGNWRLSPLISVIVLQTLCSG